MTVFDTLRKTRTHPVPFLHGTDWWTDCDDVDAEFTRTVGRRRYHMLDGSFPAEHIVYGAAIRAVF